MNTLDTIKANITTSCTCEAYEEELDTFSPASECFGDCGEDAEERATELVQNWLDKISGYDSELVKINGAAMGWTRASGYKLVKVEALEIARALYLNDDFTIEFELTADKLTASRYSHDEPTGASFEFQRVEVCSVSYCETIDDLKPDRYGEALCEFCRDVESVN